jgi:outer membrane immunogenic protein
VGWDVSEHFGLGLTYDYFHANAGKVMDNTTGETSVGLKRSTESFRSLASTASKVG